MNNFCLNYRKPVFDLNFISESRYNQPVVSYMNKKTNKQMCVDKKK